MRGEHVVGQGSGAIPGGGTGKNSAYLFKTGDGYAGGEAAQADGTGTSIFDPALCELAYRWFCPAGGEIIDPFAGGSVRGIVAALLGRRYTGIDLSARQVEANRTQAAAICPGAKAAPEWHVGDAIELPRLCAGRRFDFLFTCPPYVDLERYSDDPRDLSTMAYPEFMRSYRQIITQAVAMLRPNRSACIVVGEVRDDAGFYYGFVPDTIQAFQSAGARYYNEGILITTAGSLPVRVGKQFASGRKLGKSHQNVLTFCVGDPFKATAACEDYRVTGAA